VLGGAAWNDGGLGLGSAGGCGEFPTLSLQYTIARTCLRNRRLRFPGNANSAPEIFGRDRAFALLTRAPETNPLIKSARIAGLLSKAGKSLPSRECVVAEAVQLEPVSGANSLLAGKLTGNWHGNDADRRPSSLKRAILQEDTIKFPARKSRELGRGKQGNREGY
jgi:hypothetical protein